MFFTSSYRPDPFRFRPYQIRRGLLRWYFNRVNDYLLYFKGHFGKIHIAKEHLHQLKQCQPGTSHLIICNHTNFMDPHVTVDLTFKARILATWMAGIEPFDKGNGFFGFHIQGMGTFSIDRGITDRLALKVAQHTLDQGQHPLFIFPEGEADYTNTTLKPFYSGAFLFAINSALTHHDTTQPVYVTPMAIRYRFVNTPEKALRRDIQRLHQAIGEKHPQTTKSLETNTSLWPMLHTLIEASISYLETLYGNLTPPTTSHLPERIVTLRNHMLEQLCTEHAPQWFPQEITYDTLMQTKNKLRSLIARKVYAPPLSELTTAMEQQAQLKKALPALTATQQQQLGELEDTWLGLINTGDADDTRLTRLHNHLKQQLPFAQDREKLPQATVDRWILHLNTCRQMKLLTLLLDVLEHQDTSWEGLDETLVKLELLVLSKFNYRQRKDVDVQVGTPIDVKAFIKEHANLKKKEHVLLLSQTVESKVKQLLEQPLPEALTAPKTAWTTYYIWPFIWNMFFGRSEPANA